MHALDKIDSRLLYELDQNTRASFASVGRLVHRSAEDVRRHYERLRAQNIIRYTFPVVEYRRLGFFFIVYLLKLHNLTKDTEEDFFRYLATINELPIVMRGDGHFDVLLGICGHGLHAAERVFQEINSRFSALIMSYETAIPTMFEQFDRTYLKNNEPRATIADEEYLIEDTNALHLKEDAVRILEALNEEARRSTRELSFHLGLSYDKVKHAIKKFETSGLISRYTYLLNFDQLNISYFRVHLQLRNLSRPKERALRTWCTTHPNIIHYVRLLGAWQLALGVEIENRDALRELMREMKATFADMIIRLEITNIYYMDRYRFLPLKLTWSEPIVGV